jgi:ribosome biogenesis protein BRX1
MAKGTKKGKGRALLKKQRKKESRDMGKCINKQRTLIFASRGIKFRDRHFMKDMQDLLPHSKKDVKFDSKDKLFAVNEVCELKNCNNCVFFEARKRKDLYMWVSKTPHGPSAKFLVQNIHTMAEVKLTGNCLKGARPILSFDKNFDSEPAYQLLKELFTQVFGSPKGHPKVKPFTDHVLSFFILDNRIWFRNYQIVYQTNEAAEEGDEEATKKKTGEPMLVEIGPRFVLNPIRIFSGSFGGTTLWENPSYVSPNAMRSLVKRKKGTKFDNRQNAKEARQEFLDANPPEKEEMEYSTVFE